MRERRESEENLNLEDAAMWKNHDMADLVGKQSTFSEDIKEERQY